MKPEKLQEYIWQGTRKEVHTDKIELHLPFFFGYGDDTPLCLTWDKDGVLSDGGRTMSELKKRVGDMEPYMEKIRNILNFRNPVELVAGHKLVVRQFNTVVTPEETYVDYRNGMSYMIRTISLISVVDTIAVSENGEVSV